MKIKYLLLFISCNNLFAQRLLPPLPELIDLSKMSAIPVICHDSTWAVNKFQSGTAVIIGDGYKLCALTCEHVVSIKDSLNRTVRHISHIFLNMNKKDNTSISLKAELIYADQDHDFAILVLSHDSAFTREMLFFTLAS